VSAAVILTLTNGSITIALTKPQGHSSTASKADLHHIPFLEITLKQARTVVVVRGG
jgi:hypothetical protein